METCPSAGIDAEQVDLPPMAVTFESQPSLLQGLRHSSRTAWHVWPGCVRLALIGCFGIRLACATLKKRCKSGCSSSAKLVCREISQQAVAQRSSLLCDSHQTAGCMEHISTPTVPLHVLYSYTWGAWAGQQFGTEVAESMYGHVSSPSVEQPLIRSASLPGLVAHPLYGTRISALSVCCRPC